MDVVLMKNIQVLCICTEASVTSMKHYFTITAKKHLRAWVKHKTGGGPAPAPLTDVDQVMIRIFGNTPSFRGTLNAMLS